MPEMIRAWLVSVIPSSATHFTKDCRSFNSTSAGAFNEEASPQELRQFINIPQVGFNRIIRERFL